MKLSHLKKGQIAKVVDIESGDFEINSKLREVGFAEGDEVEMMHLGPFGGTPLCIRLNRTLVALRPNEAQYIIVGQK